MDTQKAATIAEQIREAERLPAERQTAAVCKILFYRLSAAEQEAFFARFNATIIGDEEENMEAVPGVDFEPQYTGDGWHLPREICNFPMKEVFTARYRGELLGRFDDEEEAVAELLAYLLTDYSVSVFVSLLRNPALVPHEPLEEVKMSGVL